MESRNLQTRLLVVLLLAPILLAVGCSTPKGSTVAEKRDYILNMRADTLAKLYADKPEAKTKIANAAGYGTFSNINVNLIFASAGNGYGVVHNNYTKKDTFMNMGMGGIGLGLGVKDFRAVIIYKDSDTLDKFIDKGWEFGGHADAAAKSGEKGGAVNAAGDITSGMEIYQFTETGIALQATIAGTKYWKNNQLNQ